MYAGNVQTNLAQPCNVNFWTFATPVIVGNLAAYGAGMITKALYQTEPAGTRDTATTTVRFAAFWLAAGFTWIAVCNRKGAST